MAQLEYKPPEHIPEVTCDKCDKPSVDIHWNFTTRQLTGNCDEHRPELKPTLDDDVCPHCGRVYGA